MNVILKERSLMTKKILIIDDEPSFISAITIGLSANKYNYKLTSASCGYEGIKIAKTEQPDVIFLDIVMPKIDGLQILEKLKKDKQTKDIPVIMLTKRSHLECVSKAIWLGANDYISKPFHLIELIKRLKLIFKNKEK